MTRPPRHPPARQSRRAARAFTLAELIVASIILAVVVGATTIAIGQAVRSRDAATAAGDAFSRAELAAARIAADAAQALRDGDLKQAKIAITRGSPAGKSSQGLLLFTHLARNVRAGDDVPEGDEYEVQYRLEPDLTATRSSGPTSYTLWRRADPVPDDVIDGGGVASPLTDGVVSLDLDAYDGSAWRTDWDSDNDGYPHALRVVVTATDDQGRRVATARRVVAFDRTPPPVAETEATDETEPSGNSATAPGASAGSNSNTSSTTTGGAGSGGGRGTGGGNGGGGSQR